MKRNQSIMLFSLSSLVLTAVHGYCADVPEKMNLSRKEAIELAIRHNLDLRNEALSNAMTEADAKRSHSLYNPVLSSTVSTAKSAFPGETFGVSSSYLSLGLSESLPIGGTVSAVTQTGWTNADSDLTSSSIKAWQSSVSLNLSQPLLKNFGTTITELTITLADTTLQDSLERFHGFVADTVLSVIISYNRLYTLHQALQSRQDALKSEQSMLDEINKRTTPGPKQPLEVANLQYAISQKMRELVDAERNLRDQEAGFRYMLGIESNVQLTPTDPPAIDEPGETEEQAVKSAMETRPDLKQYRLALKTAQLQERVSHHQVLPDLNFTASGSLIGTAGGFAHSYDQITEGKAWSLGLQFSMPVGNTAAVNDYRRSVIRVEQAQNQVHALEWKIRNDVQADLRALISARLQRQTTEQGLKFAEQRKAEYQKHARAGEGTVQDAINAENDLVAARNAQRDAAEAFSDAVTRLWRDSGLLLAHQGVQIEKAKPIEVTSPAGAK